MLDSTLQGVFNTGSTDTISVSDFLLCLGCSLVIGLILAFAYTIRTRFTKSFVATLAMLPAVVCVVIMIVNGNVGTGVAVAGAFSLVRFRSVPGTAKEISAIFLAMGAGLIAGMGYLALAFAFTIILSGIMILYSCLDFGIKSRNNRYKTLSITIPEDLDYTDVFGDLFSKYTSSSELVTVKTTNMGSLFKLTYNISLKDLKTEKELLDALRCRNGNLEICVSNQATTQSEL